jgi:hypothetical protein
LNGILTRRVECVKVRYFLLWKVSAIQLDGELDAQFHHLQVPDHDWKLFAKYSWFNFGY